MDVYPASLGESILKGAEYCNNEPSSCPALQAGLFDSANSRTIVEGFPNDETIIDNWGSGSALRQTGEVRRVLDTITMYVAQNNTPPSGNDSETSLFIANATIKLVEEESIGLPSGLTYSPPVGMVSLGGSRRHATYDENVIGAVLPGRLAAQNIIASNSFGLHYGSADLKLGGSLVWGGYDKSRLIGEVGAFDVFEPGVRDLLVPPLTDVQIGVLEGASPFSEESYSNLLLFNDSTKAMQPAIINPIVPYIFMSPATCDSIAEHLPVTLQPRLGLYTWNVEDPQFARIVNSPAYLAFVFSNNRPGTTNGNLTIRVPFSLLNLTLEPPIVPSRQLYFPLRPFHSLDGLENYYLGRAFLQAAFLGVNWDQETYFLVQAPGPDVEPQDVQQVTRTDTTLESRSANELMNSWRRHLTPLQASRNDSSNTTTSSGPVPTASESRLSNGVVAGIAIAAIASALGVLLGGIFLYRRKCNVSEAQQSTNEDTIGDGGGGTLEAYEKDASGMLHEAPSARRYLSPMPPCEADGDLSWVHEVEA